MEHFGKITSLEDLPSKEILKSYIREAKELFDIGEKTKPSVNKVPIPENAVRMDSV